MAENIKKKQVKIDSLVNWYYGNLAHNCEDCEVDVYYKIKDLANKLKVKELTHKRTLNNSIFALFPSKFSKRILIKI